MIAQVRRERISERMKYLQELVPGCNKVTGKACMLDEIINYVQSLQKQVEVAARQLRDLCTFHHRAASVHCSLENYCRCCCSSCP
jgi:hypothetical protein